LHQSIAQHEIVGTLISVLPAAENEGDAIEMLREKVNTSQNRNRSTRTHL
jgi:hypothetical protein